MRLIAGLLAAVLMAGTAQAQNPCGSREQGVTDLANRFGERQVAIGLSQRGAIFEVWANVETGTFTVLHSTPDGQACMVDAGEGFSLVEPQPPGEAS